MHAFAHHLSLYHSCNLQTCCPAAHVIMLYGPQQAYIARCLSLCMQCTGVRVGKSSSSMQLLPAGPCKAVLGRPDSNSATRLKAVDLSQPEQASRVPSETTLRRLSPSMMFAKTSMPMFSASSSRKDPVSGQSFLGRGLSGEPCTVQPVMTTHQLNSQDHFVVRH